MRFIKSITEKLTWGRWRTLKLNKQAKGVLALLIAEIQDCKNMTEVKP